MTGNSLLRVYLAFVAAASIIFMLFTINEPSEASIAVRNTIKKEFPDISVKFYSPAIGDKKDFEIIRNSGRTLLYLSNDIEGDELSTKSKAEKIILIISMRKYLGDIESTPNAEYLALRLEGINREIAIKEASPTANLNLLEAILVVQSE